METGEAAAHRVVLAHRRGARRRGATTPIVEEQGGKNPGGPLSSPPPMMHVSAPQRSAPARCGHSSPVGSILHGGVPCLCSSNPPVRRSHPGRTDSDPHIPLIVHTCNRGGATLPPLCASLRSSCRTLRAEGSPADRTLLPPPPMASACCEVAFLLLPAPLPPPPPPRPLPPPAPRPPPDLALPAAVECVRPRPWTRTSRGLPTPRPR